MSEGLMCWRGRYKVGGEMLNRHGMEGFFLEGGVWTETWKRTGIQPYGELYAIRVFEAKEVLRANAPKVGKSFFGTFLGRKDDRVTEA